MENNNKKSKAFIITFVIVLIVLAGLYLLYQNKETVLGTKGASTMEKVFSPLLGSSKNKNLDIVETSQNDSNKNEDVKNSQTSESEYGQNQNNTENLKEGSGNNSSGIEDSDFDSKYSLPKPSGNFGSSFFNSNSIWDNNNNIDSKNENSDSGRNGDNSSSDNDKNSGGSEKDEYDLGYKNEGDASSDELSKNACYGQAPLVFTEDELKLLDEYLKRYYAISSTLKSESSISNIKEDSSSKKALVSRINMLTTICEEQTSDRNFTGPKETLDNPYYSKLSYLNNFFTRNKIIENISKNNLFEKDFVKKQLIDFDSYLEKRTYNYEEEKDGLLGDYIDKTKLQKGDFTFIEALLNIW